MSQVKQGRKGVFPSILMFVVLFPNMQIGDLIYKLATN